MLLQARAEVDSALRDGGTPLLAAAYKGHDGCVEALLQHRAMVDAARADGLTPLCQASKAGHVRCVELLLQAKANVRAHTHPPATLPGGLALILSRTVRVRWRRRALCTARPLC